MSDPLSSIPEPDDTEEVRRLRREYAEADDDYDKAFEKWGQHQMRYDDRLDDARARVREAEKRLRDGLEKQANDAINKARSEIAAVQLPLFQPPKKV